MTERRRELDEAIPGLAWIAVGGLIAIAVAWAVPSVVALVTTGHVPRLGAIPAALAALRIPADGLWGDPASAYPPAVRAQLPGAAAWWLVTSGLLVVTAAGAALVIGRLEPLVARERLGRRAYDWQGARPRPWARHRDLRQPRSALPGFSLGRLDGRLIVSDEESHVAVVAPTRAGKTTRCVIPWLFEHRGPAIVTSTKRDVLDATREERERQGRVWVFDPFGDDTTSWSPVRGCESWSLALRQAQWLADASSDGDSEIARYWRGEAAKLLAPLLHAAALDVREMPEVLAWVDAQDIKAATTVLSARAAHAARLQLRAVADLDPRNKGTTYMSAGSVLRAYRYPELRQATGQEFSPTRFLRSPGDTLFLVAAERHQQLLAPLFVSLLTSVIHEAIESQIFVRPGRRLRVLLDEAANVAPLTELPRTLSQAAGHGLRVATVWQSLAQMRERYGAAADTILANCTSKLFLGPITDEATRSYVVGLIGDEHIDGYRRPRVSAAALQQLGYDRALLVAGEKLPALVTLRPYWAAGRRGH